MFRQILRLGGFINFGLAIVAAIQGNMPAAMVHMAACIVMDMQADILFLKEELIKVQKGAKNATESQEG